MRKERRGHTLQATALVHETYLRLGVGHAEDFESRAEFFAAAAESMRRILIDHSRARNSQKRGSGKRRLDLEELDLATEYDPDLLLDFDEALTELR